MKIGFFGTPELSAAVLRDCLGQTDVEIVYVVSQPDRPVGRHAMLTASPVSLLAIQNHIPLFRPEKDFIERNQGNVTLAANMLLSGKPREEVFTAIMNRLNYSEGETKAIVEEARRLLEKVPTTVGNPEDSDMLHELRKKFGK